MCWESKVTPVKKIADKDIKVNKLIGLYNRPYFCKWYCPSFVYKKGQKCQSVNISVNIAVKAWSNPNCSYFIEQGYHSYSKEVEILDEWSDDMFMIKYKNGDYSYIESAKFAEFIIPKGTIYYENERGEIVSETIKMV